MKRSRNGAVQDPQTPSMMLITAKCLAGALGWTVREAAEWLEKHGEPAGAHGQYLVMGNP